MNREIRMAGATIVMLLACAATGAQMRTGASPEPSAPVRGVPIPATKIATGSEVNPPSTSGPQAPRQTIGIQIAPNVRLISGIRSETNGGDIGDEIGVPGLGFDYPHLAAVSGNFRNNPSRAGGGAPREHDFNTPIFFSGFPYYSDFTDYQQVQQQPQIIVIQQPVPVVTVQQPAPAALESHADATTPMPSPEPVRDVGEFILVRRDGKVLFASAFSVVGTKLQYVTPEGIRRTMPLIELDTAATQDMNEARGTTLQFHN